MPTIKQLFRVAALSVAAMTVTTQPASAQEMVFTFKDPSFGGNPFYSDHLRATAEYGRPAQETQTQTPEDLLAAQLRSQLTSSLSTTILSRIQTAKAGESGNFTVGNQQISFTRSASETTVTFTNSKTGETSQLVIPVVQSSTQSPFSSSVEQALSAQGAGLTGSSTAASISGLELPAGPAPL